MQIPNHQLWRFVFALLSITWMIAIYYFSSRTSLPIPTTLFGLDKFLHGIAYAILGTFYTCTWNPPGQRLAWRKYAALGVLLAAYAASDEYHQLFVNGRDADLGDWLADLTGGGIAILLTGRLLAKRAPLSTICTRY